MTVKTIVHMTTQEIKKAITDKSVRNNYLKVFIIGYSASGEREPFEEDETYYSVGVSTDDHEFDVEVCDTTSLAKAKHRTKQLYTSLQDYRGNRVKLKDYDENEGLYSDD